MRKEYKNGYVDKNYLDREVDKIDRINKNKDNLRRDLKKIAVSSQDLVDLGVYSSGWDNYKIELNNKFEAARKNNLYKSFDICKHWNEIGFKTGSGKVWSIRLINVAKDKLKIKHGLEVIYL